tara:strand:+ start:392 stop:646 length:255 start_codon:yes stop_codon:yes gene_type:complete
MWFIISSLCFIVGLVLGWVAAERYVAFMQYTEHDFEELFKKNPHPELFDEGGKLDRGDYMMINFDPGFDPENWDPETDITMDEW